MPRPLSLALLIGGIALMVFGANASQSLSSDISRLFTGTPTDKSLWMLIVGLVAAVAGLVGLARSKP